jgi:hypothetical protein
MGTGTSMTTRKVVACVFSSLLMLGLSTPSGAATSGDTSIQIGVESFRWREFGDDKQQLLEEKGPRLRVGAAWDFTGQGASQAIYRLEGAVYLGQVSYDGQACLISNPSQCVPLQTDTNYLGLNLEALGGVRLGSRVRGLEFFGAAGLDQWLRDLTSGIDASGTPVGSAQEHYFILNTKAGAGFFHQPGNWSYQLRGGMKYPFFTYETTSDNVSVQPRGRGSWFATARMDFGLSSRTPMGFMLYYDSYRFQPSDTTPLSGTNLVVWQPESKQDVFGMQFVMHFR